MARRPDFTPKTRAQIAYYMQLKRRLRRFTIAGLFANGENGTWVEYKDLSTMFTDPAGTANVTTAGDLVARVDDKSGNARNHLQATTAQRPPYQITPARIVYDGVDDNMVVDFGAAFTGDVFQGTVNGILHYAISTTGTWKNPQDARYRPDDGTVTATIAREGTLGAGAVANVKTYLQNETGAGADFDGVTSMSNWFRLRTDVTAIYSGDWDTSAVTDFSLFAVGCSSLTTLDVSSWNTSSVTDFSYFAYGCSSLTTLDVSSWNTSSVTSFSRFAYGCSSLTTVIVTGGTGNPFADSPCTNYADAFTSTNLTQASIDAILVAIEDAATSNGTFNQSGGSAPSATGEAAVTALRARGWTVTVTGGF